MESPSTKTEKIILGAVLILAVFLILFHFTDTPKVWVDEGVFTEVSKNLATKGVLGVQTSPGEFFSMRNLLLTTSYPVIFPVATSLKIFGVGIWQARLPMILYMFALVLLFYLFAKKRYGFYEAVLSVLLLLSFSPFYGNGRPVQGEVPALVFLLLACYLLLLWEERFWNDKKLAFFCGLSFGLAVSVKPIFLVCILPALILCFIFWFKKIHHKTEMLVFAAGFVPPVLLWLYIHFPTLDALMKLVPTFLYFGGTHDPSTSTLQTVLHNFGRFFTESTPILFSVLISVVFLSILLRFFKKESKGIATSELILVSFIVLNSGAYLFGTGWYRYFFPAHTLLYLLFPGAIICLAEGFSKKFVRKISYIVLGSLIVFQFYFLVFLSDTSFTVRRTRNAELSSALQEIPSIKKILFYNTIEAVVFLQGDNYSQYLAMDTFLVAGDKDSLLKPDYDFILTDKSQSGNVALRCYKEKPLNQYYFLEKTTLCKQ